MGSECQRAHNLPARTPLSLPTRAPPPAMATLLGDVALPPPSVAPPTGREYSLVREERMGEGWRREGAAARTSERAGIRFFYSSKTLLDRRSLSSSHSITGRRLGIAGPPGR